MRVLLVKLSSMGDVIHTLPALTDAYNKVPDLEVTWVVEHGFQEIAKWHPAVKDVIPVALRKPKRKLKEIWASIRNIRANSYDVVIDAQGLIKSSIIAKLARSKYSIGYDKASIREPMASLLYTRTIAVMKEQHAIPRVRQLFAKALDYDLDFTNISYGIVWPQVAITKIAKPYLFFLHGTTWESKHWPDEYWIRLANIVAQYGLEVYVTWATEQQKARAQMLAHQCKNVTMLPHLTINQAANIIYNAKGIVAVDTGFAHLAAAIDKPMVAIYGATDIKKAGTLGENSINLASNFKCAPCAKRICNYQGVTNFTPACYEEISPQLVWQKLATLLADAK